MARGWWRVGGMYEALMTSFPARHQLKLHARKFTEDVCVVRLLRGDESYS